MSREWEREEPRPETRPYSAALPAADHSLLADMRHYLSERVLSYKVATENLWYPSSHAGDRHPRIVIPAASEIRGNCYWQARSMIEVPEDARYLSPFSPRGDAVVVVYPGSHYSAQTKAVIAEGPMDALAAATVGCLGIGLMGMSPPDAALRLLVRYLVPSMQVYLVADVDQPQAMQRTMRKLIGMGCKSELNLVLPSPAKDFAEADTDLRYELIGGDA